MQRCPYCGEYRSLVLVRDGLARYPQYHGYLPCDGVVLVCPDCGVILPNSEAVVREPKNPVISSEPEISVFSPSLSLSLFGQICGPCSECKKTLKECSLRDWPLYDGYGRS